MKIDRRAACIRMIVVSIFLAACRNEPSLSPLSPPVEEAAPDPFSEAIQPSGEIPARELLITEKAFIRVAKKVTPAVVNISTVHFVRHPESPLPQERGFLKDFLGDLFENAPRREFRQKSLGSGFIISKEGFILTNYHVIAEADKITVKLSDRREFIGQIIEKDPKSDLAVIKIPPQDDLPIVHLGDSGRIEVGEWAIAIGNPFGLDRTVTVGVISATGRTDLGLTLHDNFIQTDASINFGNSGGPLLNARGEVVGINTAIVATGQGIGFAIPINMAKSVMGEWIAKGKIKQNALGS
ncbi:MAG TPA: trypsin-like peptidase domain-containing protein [Candidatus Manganitrophaceae bacterium]|nr:trypsin-like peptidase domain-containing protein [Candidatus Manganitrophaceae bacterium]